MYVGGMLARNIVCVTLLYVLRFFRCASLPIVIMEQRDSKGGTWALWSLLDSHKTPSQPRRTNQFPTLLRAPVTV